MKPHYPRIALDVRARTFLESLDDSPQTRATYEYALKAFYSFRRSYKTAETDAAPTPLGMSAMDANVLGRFQTWLKARYSSRFTRQTYLAGATAFLEFAQDQDWLPKSFSLDRARYRKRKAARRRESYPIPKLPDGMERVIGYYETLALPTGDTVKEKLERLRILRGRALLQVLYATAGRVSAVGSLTRKGIQDGRRAEVEVIDKGDYEHFLFFTSDSQTAIQLYLQARGDTCEPLFIRHSKGYGRPLTRAMLWQIVNRAAKACGVHVHPHDFRHFRARQMLEQGAPLEAIQEILGHKDIGTTRRVYAHYSKPTIRNIFDKTTLKASTLTTA